MTAEPDAAQAVVERIYAAMQTGDYAVIAAHLDDRVVLHEPAGHPYPGTWAGRDAVLAVFPNLLGSIGMTGLTVREIVAGPRTAVGLIDLHLTATDGTPFTMEVAELWRVADGKVVEVRPYYHDTRTLAQRCT